MHALLKEEFDASNETHVGYLRAIWNGGLVPGELPSPVSPNEQWKAIGFQQPKIESDLRGVGVLGLMQMAELATHFEAPFRAAIEREKVRLPSNYPVAVGVIRVT